MNKPTLTTNIMLPSDIERQKIFYWLQKMSSITAWRRIFEYYKAWATATENSVREADELGWGDKTSLPETDYILVLKGLAHCEEGTIRLGNGDKRIFKFDSNGELAMAFRILSHWSKMITRIKEGENGIDELHTPLWPQFTEALTAAHQAWQECSTAILEPRYIGEPGLILYGNWLKHELKGMIFPEQLDSVPNPSENTFVHTNEYTPYSGIWEPIETPRLKKTSILSFFNTYNKPEPPFKIMGAMNYLHGGSTAPQITVETATDNIHLDTMWRLLWRDDRYINGNIPKKEADYRFKKPATTTPENRVATSTENVIWAESGTTVPLGGTWLVESDLKEKIKLNKGEKLPLHQGRGVRWVLAVN